MTGANRITPLKEGERLREDATTSLKRAGGGAAEKNLKTHRVIDKSVEGVCNRIAHYVAALFKTLKA